MGSAFHERHGICVRDGQCAATIEKEEAALTIAWHAVVARPRRQVTPRRRELAAAAGKDPLQYLRLLLGPPRKIDLKAIGVDYPNYGASIDRYPIDTARMRTVLDLAAESSGWGRPLPPRHGRGIAVHRSFLSYVAAVAEVAVGNDGQITVPRIDIAIDCGLAVNRIAFGRSSKARRSWASATRSTATSR